MAGGRVGGLLGGDSLISLEYFRLSHNFAEIWQSLAMRINSALLNGVKLILSMKYSIIVINYKIFESCLWNCSIMFILYLLSLSTTFLWKISSTNQHYTTAAYYNLARGNFKHQKKYCLHILGHLHDVFFILGPSLFLSPVLFQDCLHF